MNILITGASKGLGKALALCYAKSGNTLYLISRDKDKLEEVKSLCKQKNAEVITGIIDVRDYNGLKNFFHNIQDLDIAYANAGISYGTSEGPENYEKTKELLDTNIYGVINTFSLAQDLFLKKRKGHIIIISSIAGINPLSSCPSYSSSKAFVRYYGLAQNIFLSNYGITVTVVNPGFIDTNMTKNNKFPMPFMISAEKAAEIIIKGVEKKKDQITFPIIMNMISHFIYFLPLKLKKFLLKRLPKK